jgi:hypothetical protein
VDCPFFVPEEPSLEASAEFYLVLYVGFSIFSWDPSDERGDSKQEACIVLGQDA